MGTSLTPEFWNRFAVLLVLAVGLTCVLTAALDGLAVRMLRRRGRRAQQASYRPERHHRSMSVHS